MQLRSDFVAEVSHELRTPLTQIRMFTESLLLRRLSSAEDRSRALSIINREAQRLIHMVENILRFSENERQAELAPQRQAIAPILISVVDEFQVLANAAEATITTNIDDAVEANIDADAIRQVILNLLDNAIKYGPRGQTVHVELQAVRDTIHITVADAGPGIPESERQRIFAGYYRLDRERDSAIAGTGIGLSVVGDIVRQHGGSVHVEDAENGGARFVVELPR
jgi:signal transduction histidine kinase